MQDAGSPSLSQVDCEQKVAASKKCPGHWFNLQVAPLRVRPADVADLQKLFVRGIAKSRGQGPLSLTPEAVLQPESYSFPGNIKVPLLA